MSHRTITDEFNVCWDVWEVVPASVERRVNAGIDAREENLERRTGKRGPARVVVQGNMQQGWLAFQCPSEKRRLAPAPENWASFTDEELLELLRQATSVGKPKRLIE